MPAGQPACIASPGYISLRQLQKRLWRTAKPRVPEELVSFISFGLQILVFRADKLLIGNSGGAVKDVAAGKGKIVFMNFFGQHLKGPAIRNNMMETNDISDRIFLLKKGKLV